MSKKIILNITPQTYVRATQNDRVFFRIPRDKLNPPGRKRLERLEKYNNYKIALLAVAKQNRFMLPEQGAEIVFYIPVSPSWKKHKKESMHMKLHRNKPDLSNMLKAFEDGLMAEDKGIAHYAGLAKIWINEPNGRIEVTITTPTLSSQDVLL
jgi:Holliday junction resolvase RusA-like endonuclease